MSESRVCYVGIDVGLDGGVAALDPTGGVVLLAVPMPRKVNSHGRGETDAAQLASLLIELEPGGASLACIEYLHSFGTEARSSIFSFGTSNGKVKAVLEVLQLPFIDVPPTEWKKEVLKGTKMDKLAAIGWCRQRWPELKFQKPKGEWHDGIADALCMAEYARRQALGKK